MDSRTIIHYFIEIFLKISFHRFGSAIDEQNGDAKRNLEISEEVAADLTSKTVRQLHYPLHPHLLVHRPYPRLTRRAAVPAVVITTTGCLLSKLQVSTTCTNPSRSP